MSKLISLEDAVNLVRDGDTIMVGGFLAVGTPERLIDALIAKGVKDLTLICNDTGFVDRGVGKMVVAKMFTKNHGFSHWNQPRNRPANAGR